jgi:hypothetical protein
MYIYGFGKNISIREAIGADDHGSNTKNISGAETFRKSPHMFNSDRRNSSYAQKSVFS